MKIDALVCYADGRQVIEERDYEPQPEPVNEPTADELLKILAGVTE